MSFIFLKRFIKEPGRVASIIPSSPILVRRVQNTMDHSKPRIIAEFGPGEGVHTRALLKRAHADSKILLFELDPELAEYLRKQFADDKRVEVLCEDCEKLPQIAADRGIDSFDYIFSGIPFSTMDKKKKQGIMHACYESLRPGGDFIIYQITNELKRFGEHFDQIDSDWCFFNVPPMYVTVYHKNGTESSARVRRIDEEENGREGMRDRETA